MEEFNGLYFAEVRKEEVMAIKNRFPTKIPVSSQNNRIKNNYY